MGRRSPLTRSGAWLVTLLLLGTLLIACGGGDDGDSSDGDATPTAAAATATTASASEATATTGDTAPTSAADASPTSGSVIGGNAQPTATGGSGGPQATPTERPVSVVTTPKPIATRPALPTVGTDTGSTDATETTGEGTILVYEDFEDGTADGFFVGSNEGGTTAEVANGAYSVTVSPGFWQSLTIGGSEETGDGVIWADATLNSTGGSVGLVARQFNRSDGGYQFIVCWLDTDGTTGCTLVVDSNFAEMFRQPAGTIPVQEVNTLLLSVVADGLYFEVNGVEVGSYTLTDTEPGSWGLFLEAWENDNTTVTYDNVVVWSAE